MELDRISKLPDDVTENILSSLPLKEAVRTSVLSTKWRYKWEMLRSLVFDDKCVSTRIPPICSFVNIVDHVLLLHTRPIHKFQLTLNRTPNQKPVSTRDIDRWIFHLSKIPAIKEMILQNLRADKLYSIPSCLFSCQDIVFLDLVFCLVKPPTLSTSKGFRSLNTLVLVIVTMDQIVFENLISCSPLLKKLSLIYCKGFTNYKINAPKLQTISIRTKSWVEEFNLDDSSNLADASFNMQINVADQSPGSSGSTLINFFYNHPHIQRFTVNKSFLKYLSIGVLPEKLPQPCQCLHFLSLEISFDHPDEISTVLCLLSSSPALQELEIMMDPGNDQAAVREVKSCLYDNYNCPLTQLQRVKMTKISCAKAQLNLIKFLLLSSPMLERMTIQPFSADGFSNLVKDLLMFKRASKSAEIMLLDP